LNLLRGIRADFWYFSLGMIGIIYVFSRIIPVSSSVGYNFQMARLLLVFVCLSMASGQNLFRDPPEFARILNEVLATVTIGSDPQSLGALINVTDSHALDLPAASLCQKSRFWYRCYWESKSNKYSVAMLQDDISSQVAAALPKTWRRERGEFSGVRFADFTDPTGEFVITVSSQISLGELPPQSYVASLTLHRTRFRMR
jgi:hypothetical protein